MQSFRTWYYREIEATVTLKIRSEKYGYSLQLCRLYKVFAILILSFLVMNVTGFTFRFMTYAKHEVYEATI